MKLIIALILFQNFDALYYSGGFFATEPDISPVMLTTLVLTGLSLVHYMLSKIKHAWIGLLLMYVMMVISFPFGFGMIALMGLVGIFVHFHKSRTE